MSTVNFTLVRDEKGRSLTVYIDRDGEFNTHVLSTDHANFQTVLDYLLDEEPDNYDVDWLEQQVNVLLAVGTRLNGLSERVRVTETALTFDGDPLHGALVDHIIRLVREGDGAKYGPLVAFLEKVQTNPSQASIDSLYTWVTDRELSITPDGDFIAYKGVKLGPNKESLSIHSGKAIVDGVITQGYIVNNPGSVIEMPRSEVQANTQIGCSTGLHAGTWGYASSFAQGRVLVVKINPRDVVSVPDDSSYQKLRVSRYIVLSEIANEYHGTVYDQYDGAYDEEDEDLEDGYWGDGDEYFEDDVY